ncbi:hypothetical protein [Streptomyces sp. G1]|uniref:hypothetical protein n=1 Tax=Streptomyces sp. G1 TaxID=361572 RepID=UPI002030A76A|nr:hypothetical protein [Streptomyces sp. G1]MCM1972310.1 hypothetical protein [Streptomyces sp. G1]
MHTRTALAVVVLAAALTACSEPTQGTAERQTAAASTPKSSAPDCGPDSGLSQADWIEQCASDSPAADEQPDTELAVGDTFAYTDGIKAKVDSISTITQYGEYDDKPDADQQAFRVTFTITNGTKKPYDLDNFSYDAQGATTGGQTESLYVETGSKEIAGRLAPGRSGTFTSEYAIDKADGKEIVFTLSRMDDEWLESGKFLGEDPNWTGSIK